MAWTAPRTWNAGETVTSTLMNLHIRDNLNYLKAEVDLMPFSRGGTLWNPNGIIDTVNLPVWLYVTRACTVTHVKGWRVGGTGATINARKNGSSTHLSSALSLTSASTVMDGGAEQNTGYVIGDRMEMMIVSLTGDPTEVAVQINLEPA